jgi:hypothetical protein
MSLEFVIIPFNSTFEETALTIKSNITDSIPSIELAFDSDYSKSYNNRLNKWKQEDYNIIMVNQDYIDGKQERMTIDEFIELMSNFEQNDDNSDSSDKSGGEDNCIIC